MAKLRRPDPPTPKSPEEWLAGRVSVACPTTDSRQEFHGQLWSVFEAQTWADKELVVVETYTDRPSPFFTEKAKSDKRLIFVPFRVTKDADWSIGLKRNICTHMASGHFMANFDDDDLYAPSYLETMVQEMLSQKSEAITLTTYYIFDARCSKFGWVDQRFASDSQRYGFGFSYVFLRWSSLCHPYPNQNMGEDYTFFNTLRLRRQGTVFGGQRHVALHADECGICCHTLHPKSTSGVYAKRQVNDEEIEGLDIASLGIFAEYLGRFPQTASVSGYISGRSERREQTLKVRLSIGEFEVTCAVGATARELLELLHPQLSCGGQPSDLRLHRSRPPAPEAPPPPREPPAESRKIRAIAVHGAASNSNLMKFQTTMLRKALGKDIEWLFPDGPVPWFPKEEGQDAEATGTGGISDYFARRSAFEERIAGDRPFLSWFELDPSMGDSPTEASKEAAIAMMIDFIAKEEPVDLVVAFQQSASLMNVVSERLRRARGCVPWRMNIHFSSTPVNDVDTDQITEPLPTPTFLVDCPGSHFYERAREVYPRLFSALEVFDHQDGFAIPTTPPRAGYIYSLLAEEVWRHCNPAAATSAEPADAGPPAMQDDERVRVRDTELWASLPAERHAKPTVFVRVSDMRFTEVSVRVKVHAITQLSGLRQALLEQHGGAGAAAQKAARAVKLAERFGKGGGEDGYFFKGVDAKQWLLDRREFFAMGLQELLAQTAAERGHGLQVRVHAMGIQGFLLVEVPSPGTLRELRAALRSMLPYGTAVFQGAADPPEGVPLQEDARLPGAVIVQDFRSAKLIKGKFFESMFLTRAQAIRAQEDLRDELKKPRAQELLDQWEAEAQGDQRKYRIRMGASLHEEVYKRVLESYGLPATREGVIMLSSSIRTHFLPEKDKEMVGNWLEIERLCRNPTSITAAERAYALACS